MGKVCNCCSRIFNLIWEIINYCNYLCLRYEKKKNPIGTRLSVPDSLTNRFHPDKPGQRVAGSAVYPCMGICCKSGHPFNVYRMD